MSDKKCRRLRVCVVLVLLCAFFFLFLTMKAERAPWAIHVLTCFAGEKTQPTAFGTFHIVHLALCLIIAVLFGIFGSRHTGKGPDAIVFATGIVLLFLEIFKQLFYYFVLGDGWYDFSIFPFQFCTFALYFFLLTPMLPPGRVKDALYKFLALFGTMGGCLVMAYPVFYKQTVLCYHTMLWHIIMISVGVFILFSCGYGKHYLKEMLPATCVFLPLFLTSIVLNLALTPLTDHSPGHLNLFYMSPYETCTYMIIGDVQAAFGWIPSLITYALMFIFVGATTVFGCAFLIRLIARLIVKKNNKK